MCRWITLLSSSTEQQVALSDIILSPSNSLIQLSIDASFHPAFTEINNHVTNGDGFGIGWYHNTICTSCRNTTTTTNNNNNNNNNNTDNDNSNNNNKNNDSMMSAAVFKDTQPAWNNMNLRELCMAVQSHCIVAHVRAASVFAGISQQNCHPFKAGSRLLFCHNGRIGNFNMVRRKFHTLLSDEAYLQVKGTTDSEILFHLLCTYLSRDGCNESAYQQTKPFGWERLTNAIKKLLKTIEQILHENGLHDNEYSTLNFALTDGETMVVTRFCDKSPIVAPPSLYFAFGDANKLHEELIHSNTDEPVPQHSHHSHESSVATTMSSTSSSYANLSDIGSDNNSDVDSNHLHTNTHAGSTAYSERNVYMNEYESKPGTIYTDVNVNSASFIVASCPLTKTHTWHPMPKNSIMWYTRGSLPELRILKQRIRTKSFFLSTNPWTTNTTTSSSNDRMMNDNHYNSNSLNEMNSKTYVDIVDE